MFELDQWESSVHTICGNFHTQAHRDIPFIGNMHLNDHSGLETVHIETNARQIKRAKTACQDDKHFFVIFQQKGNMGFTSEQGEDFLLMPGEVAFIDSSAPYSMHPQGLIQQMSVHLPKTELSGIAQQTHKQLVKLPQHHISGQLLQNMLYQLTQTITHPLAYNEDGEALQNAISALIKPSLFHLKEHPQYSLKEQAKQHILRRLTDPHFGPVALANEMQISKRSLYRLFAEDNISIAHFILQLRIEKCCADLLAADTTSQPLSITEAAFRWGFSDTSQFSRAFKRVKGCTPSQWRQTQHQ